MAIQEEEDLYQHPDADPQAREFLALLAAVPWLLKQYLADTLNLLETEGRLAFRSLLMILGLTLCLAALIAGSWLVVVVLAVYWAVMAGIAPWVIILTVVAVHILVFAGLAQQIISLARFLFFPNSRRALARLLTRPRPPTP
jgi:hypothetical protein